MDTMALKAWFLAEKRDFPWRRTSDPYAIWVSEVMLQQTQAATVVPYFLKWMRRFPTPQDLAQAPLEEVLKLWEGLGYYSRARHLHEGAKQVVEEFGGSLPPDERELKRLKGVGPYTLGAILSFAFHQRKAAVDGNVLRVLARHFGCREDLSKPAALRHLRRIAQELLPAEEPWIVSEALIELGATICRPRASCSLCPLKESCTAFRQGTVESLPVKSKKTSIERLHRSVAVIQSGSSLLVVRGKKGGVMADLYEFPYTELGSGDFSPLQLQREMERRYALELIQRDLLPEEEHRFTRYAVRLYPVLFACATPRQSEGAEWLPIETLRQLAFSSGHRRVFHSGPFPPSNEPSPGSPRRA